MKKIKLTKKIYFLILLGLIFFSIPWQKIEASCCYAMAGGSCEPDIGQIACLNQGKVWTEKSCSECSNSPCYCNGSGPAQPSTLPSLPSQGTGSGYQAGQPIVPQISIPIPGLTLTSDSKLLRVCAECSEAVSDGSTCPDDKCVKWTYKIPWIGEYIFAFYRWAVSAIAIFAVLVIINAGFGLVLAAGNATKLKSAQDNIWAGIIGLFLILIMHQVLAMVDPRLVILKPIVIGSIKRVELDIEVVTKGTDSNGASNSSNTCAVESALVKINSSLVGGVSGNTDGRLLVDVYNKLLEAETLAQAQNKKIYVASAFRTLATQQGLWDKAVKKYGSESAAAPYVARPSCGAPHLTGRAIDVCIAGSTSCGKIDGAYARYSDSDVIFLQNIMTQVGFVRYCAEWWHFEYGTSRWESGKTLPPGPGRCK